MIAFGLAFAFFPRQIARGAVLVNRYILRRDISAEQPVIERKLRITGYLIIAFYAIWTIYDVYSMVQKN